jgi:thiol peroxidase
MAQITLRGNQINTVGELPAVGSPAPGFTLTGTDLGEVSSAQFGDTPVLLNIFPSVDTPVCATSVRTFNDRVAASGVSVLCISKDLPFAQNRFCGAEGIESVTAASAFRDSFGEDYGITIADGPMAGLLGRAVVVIGADGNVVYVELVPERAKLRCGAGSGELVDSRRPADPSSSPRPLDLHPAERRLHIDHVVVDADQADGVGVAAGIFAIRNPQNHCTAS